LQYYFFLPAVAIIGITTIIIILLLFSLRIVAMSCQLDAIWRYTHGRSSRTDANTRQSDVQVQQSDTPPPYDEVIRNCDTPPPIFIIAIKEPLSEPPPYSERLHP
jgi:hypothetical protein